MAESVASGSSPGFELPVAPAPTQVEPTVSNRIAVLDVLRGVAILGILLANMPAFAGPEFSAMMGATGEDVFGADRSVEIWTTVFVTGKFRSMLAMLFGAGIYLQWRKRSEVAGNWPGGYLKRTLFLALFGLIHGYLIWPGDILFIYACSAILVALIAGIEERAQRWVVGLGAGFVVLVGLGALAATLLLPEGLAAFGEGFEGGFSAAKEIAVFQQGSYLEQLGFRATIFSLMAAGALVLAPWLVTLMLLGFLLAKHRVIQAPSQNPVAVRRLLLIGLGLGLPLNLVPLLRLNEGDLLLPGLYAELFSGPLLALGYLTLGAVLVEKGLLRPIQRAVAKVGQTAMTQYLLQSLVLTVVFYSWGFGWFGKLDRTQQLGAVLAMWVVNLVCAHVILSRWKMGPFEWLWRSLTEGRRV